MLEPLRMLFDLEISNVIKGSLVIQGHKNRPDSPHASIVGGRGLGVEKVRSW